MADAKGIHKDLYWALRGGGNSNFGVVTSFKIRVYPVANTIFQVRQYKVNATMDAEVFVRCVGFFRGIGWYFLPTE